MHSDVNLALSVCRVQDLAPYYTTLSNPAGNGPSPSEGSSQNLSRWSWEREKWEESVFLDIKTTEGCSTRGLYLIFLCLLGHVLCLFLKTRSDEAGPMTFVSMYPHLWDTHLKPCTQ